MAKRVQCADERGMREKWTEVLVRIVHREDQESRQRSFDDKDKRRTTDGAETSTHTQRDGATHIHSL